MKHTTEIWSALTMAAIWGQDSKDTRKMLISATWLIIAIVVLIVDLVQ